MTSEPTPHVIIDDTQPNLVRNWADLLYALSSLILGLLVIASAMLLSGTTNGVESDARSAGKIISWMVTDLPCSMLQQGLTLTIVSVGILYIVIAKQWLRAALAVITMFIAYGAVWSLSYALESLHSQTLLIALQSQSTTAVFELLPDMYAVLVAFLTITGPQREHPHVRWCWIALCTATPIFTLVSWHSLTGVIISWCLGRTIGTLIRFAQGTRNKGAWGYDIVTALDHIGIHNLVKLSKRTQQADHSGVLRSSLDDDLIENSRLYDAFDMHGTHYVISVLDNQMHLPGYLNQLWQWARFIDVPVRRDRSARHSVHHHLSMLLVLRSLHLATANFYGVSDTETSSIFVFKTFGALVPCNLNTLTVEDAARLMRYLDIANMRGVTHRRITPETLARLKNGTPVIAGWQNGDVASDFNNVALDKVQLLTLLATCMGIDQALEAAQEAWSNEKLAAIVPFIQKAAIPTSTKSLPLWNKKLVEQLRNQLTSMVIAHTDDDEFDKVRLLRFNLRFFVSLLLSIVAVAVIVTQWHPQEVIAAVHQANPMLVLLCFACSMVAWIGSSLTLGSFIDEERPGKFTLFCSQAASGFTVVSMPAGVGPAFVNLQLLRKIGYAPAQATAITSAVWIVQAMVTTFVIFIIGIFTGRNVLSGMIPAHMLITVLGIVTLLVCVAMAITPLRKMLRNRYLPILFSYGQQIKELLTHPRQLLVATAGGFVLVSMITLGYWIALLAFNYYANPWETALLFLLANTAGSAIPTPGGLGAVEASLTFAFTSVGIPPTIALSATLLYRLMFYWLRIPIGAVSMRWLAKRELI